MDRQDDPLAEQPGQPAESGRAFGVDMHDIVRAERRRKAGKKLDVTAASPFLSSVGTRRMRIPRYSSSFCTSYSFPLTCWPVRLKQVT